MDAILDAGFPSRFRFYRIPIKHRAPVVFPLISIPNSIFKTNLPRWLPSFSRLFRFRLFFLEIYKILRKCEQIYQSSNPWSNQEMFAISLSSCSRYNANFKSDQLVSAIHDSPPYFWDQWGWPPTQHRWSPTPAIIDEL
jgi:hypothetical protein